MYTTYIPQTPPLPDLSPSSTLNDCPRAHLLQFTFILVLLCFYSSPTFLKVIHIFTEKNDIRLQRHKINLVAYFLFEKNKSS